LLNVVIPARLRAGGGSGQAVNRKESDQPMRRRGEFKARNAIPKPRNL
jgi:hypothetical protein